MANLDTTLKALIALACLSVIIIAIALGRGLYKDITFNAGDYAYQKGRCEDYSNGWVKDKCLAKVEHEFGRQ